jgi:hypothetical protein
MEDLEKRFEEFLQFKGFVENGEKKMQAKLLFPQL